MAAGWQVAVAGLGAAALALALLRIRADEANRAGALAAGAGLGLVGLVAAIPLLWRAAAGDVLAVHEAARETPIVTVALLGLAALLATTPGRGPRTGAAAVALLAALPLGLATDAFVDRFVRDPLLVPAAGFETTAGAVRLLHRVRLTVRARDLRLSPSGSRYAVTRWADRAHDGREWIHVVGSFSDGYREVPGSAVAFLADDRLLVLAAARETSELRIARADDPRVTLWRGSFPQLHLRDVAVSPARGTWQASAPDPATGTLVVLTGRADADAVEQARYPLPEALDPQDLQYVTGSGAALALDRRYEGGPDIGDAYGVRAILGWFLSPPLRARWDVWLLAPRGSRRLWTSALDTECLAPDGDPAAFVCLSRHGGRSWIWRVDPATGEGEPLGRLSGELDGIGADGPRRVALRGQSELALLDVATRHVRRFEVADEGAGVHDLAAAPGRLATLSRQADATQLTLYEMR